MARSTSSTTPQTPAVSGTKPRSWFGRRRWTRYSAGTFYLFVSPWVLGFVGLTIIPMGYALLLSFTNYDGISPIWHWIGIQNYSELLHDPGTYQGLTRTIFYALLTVPLSVAGGVGLAVLLNRRYRAVGLLRTIFYLPSVVPVVASAFMFRLLFDRDNGAINALIESVHGTPIIWLIDPTAFVVLVVMVIWGLGGGMIISLAGLQAVPPELLEAAAVDGAGPFTIFWRITFPLLSPVLFFQVVTGIVYALQTLIQPLLLNANTGGQGQLSPASIPLSNQLYLVKVYSEFFYYQRFGFGAAQLWVLFAFILIVTTVIFRTNALWVYYEVDQESGK